LRTGAFRARRGHFNYRQRELRCPARSPAGGRGGEGRGRERRAGEGRFAGLSLRLGNGYGGVRRGTRLLDCHSPPKSRRRGLILTGFAAWDSLKPRAGVCARLTRALRQARPILR